MPFTDQEIESATASIVRDSIRRQYGSLGERMTTVSFDDLMESAAGVFLQHPTAVFYLILLATKRALEVLEQELDIITELREHVTGTGRKLLEKTSTTALEGARSALVQLSNGVGARTTGVRGIGGMPAYVRLNSQLEAFLAGPAQNIRQNGEIVRTPAEARAQIPVLRKDLQDTHEELVRRLTLISEALDSYNSLGLPAVISQGVIDRALQQVTDLGDRWGKASPAEQESMTREVTLSVLAQKATLRKLGTLDMPVQHLALAGTLTGYSDLTHLASPAQLRATLPGPYSLVEGSADRVSVTLDGAAQEVTLAASYVAQVQGSVYGPYEITGSNERLILRVSLLGAASTLNFTLTNGTRTTTQVVGDMNSAFTSSGIGLTASVVTANSKDYIRITYTGANAAQNRASIEVVDDVLNTAAETLGFIRGTYQESVPTRARDVAVDLNRKLPTGLASTELVTLRESYLRTNPAAPEKLEIYQAKATGVVTNPASTLIQVVFPAGTSMTEFQIGRLLVFRAGPNTGRYWTITSVVGTTVAGTGADVPVPETREVEVAIALNTYTGYVIRVVGAPNNGDFEVHTRDTTYPCDAVLRELLPAPGDPVTGQAIELGLSVVGFEHLVFGSRNTTTASRTQVAAASSQSASSKFFSVLPADARGTTPWLQLSVTSGSSSGLRVGDLIESYTSSYTSPSSTYQVTSLEGQIVGIDQSVAVNTSLNLSTTSTVPFARLASGGFSKFSELKDGIDSWLSQISPTYFINLDRLLNPCLRTPTLSQVGDADNSLEQLGELLDELSLSLNQYTADQVPQVEALLDTLRVKGADRARDLLLEADVEGFFGSTIETSSYSGQLQAAIKEVAREDMPVRKERRQDRTAQRVLASQQDQDYEYEMDEVAFSTPDITDDVERTTG